MVKRYFEIWTSIGELETDYSVPYVTAAAWCRRGEIPRAYDLRTMQIAQERGWRVAPEALDAWHRAHKERRVKCREIGCDPSDEYAPELPELPFCQVERAVK